MDAMNETGINGLLADLMPIFKHIPVQQKSIKLLYKARDALFKLVGDIYDEHKKIFDESKYF